MGTRPRRQTVMNPSSALPSDLAADTSWYAASAPPAPPHPRLSGEHRVDVAILGAGYTGLSAALELAGRGYRVAVVEATRVGGGASGRNGGQLITGFNPPYLAATAPAQRPVR